jgi:uncharacterized RDD family membrane protein YckC
MESEPLDKAYLENLQKFGPQYYGRYSTLWERWFANTLDGIVVSAGLMLVSRVFGREYLESVDMTWAILENSAIFLYSILLHARSGRTVGKRLMGLKVIDQSETKEITAWQAVARDAIPLLLVAAFLVAGTIGNSEGVLSYLGYIGVGWSMLEIISVLSNDRRRALHDFLAGTVVVKA